MFSQLIESGARPRRQLTQGALSLVFHVAIGVGAVEASRRVATPPAERPRVHNPVFLAPKPPPAPPVDQSDDGFSPGPYRADQILPDQVLIPPRSVPDGIPPIDLGDESIDPRRFELGRPTVGCPGCPTNGEPSSLAYTEETVDQPAEVVYQPAPGYPPVLRTAGISGRVVLQFVVDTVGTVEAGSIVGVESTNPLFEVTARAAIERSRFRPARVKGVPVRQLVRQVVKFVLE